MNPWKNRQQWACRGSLWMWATRCVYGCMGGLYGRAVWGAVWLYERTGDKWHEQHLTFWGRSRLPVLVGLPLPHADRGRGWQGLIQPPRNQHLSARHTEARVLTMALPRTGLWHPCNSIALWITNALCVCVWLGGGGLFFIFMVLQWNMKWAIMEWVCASGDKTEA